MTQNIEQRTEAAVSKYEGASDVVDALANTDSTVETGAGNRKSFPKLSREIEEDALESIRLGAGDPQGNYAVGVTFDEPNWTYTYNGQQWGVGKDFDLSTLPYEATQLNPSSDGNLAVRGEASQEYVQIEVTRGQGENLEGNVYPPGNLVLEDGDIVTEGTTHLRVLVGGNKTIVEMNPVASGVVSALSDIGATVGVTDVNFYNTTRGGVNKSLDIFVAYGQSNAKGTAGNSPGTLEYNTRNFKVYNGTSLQDMTSYTPTQNDGNSTGSMWPAFFNEIASSTGKSGVFANCAADSQSIADLSKGAINTNYSGMVEWVNEIKQLIINDGYEVGNVYFIFWQGERDAQLETPPVTYKAALEQLWSDIKLDTQAVSFNVIPVGAYTLTTVRQSKPINSIQQQFCIDNGDVKSIFSGAPSTGLYGMKIDTVHLNQKGYNFVGQAAAKEFVISNYYTNSVASKSQLLEAGSLRIDGSQLWEVFGGVTTKSAAQTWSMSLGGVYANSGIHSITDDGTHLTITLTREVDYFFETSLSFETLDGDSKFMRAEVINTSVNDDGYTEIQVEFYADVIGQLTFNNPPTFNTNAQAQYFDDEIVATWIATGIVNLTHGASKGLVTACPSNGDFCIPSTKYKSNTESEVRCFDGTGTLIDSKNAVITIPSCSVKTDSININTRLSIVIVAAKKSTS